MSDGAELDSDQYYPAAGRSPLTRESLGLGTHEALHQAEHKLSQNNARNY